MCLLNSSITLGNYTINNDRVNYYLPNATLEAQQYCNTIANEVFQTEKDHFYFNFAFSVALKKCFMTDKLRDCLGIIELHTEK